MAEKDSEHSAGGIIVENGRVLLIQMRNLAGAPVWTFPKGHIEPGETPEAAAIREVAEETGYDCAIAGEIHTARYSFIRNGRRVEKDVRWYLMRLTGGDGVVKTPDEISAVEWLSFEDALGRLTYPSDLTILDLLRTAQ
jgi:8-oxo-dGTP pyrophosphatase MutT (NUDIX family)